MVTAFFNYHLLKLNFIRISCILKRFTGFYNGHVLPIFLIQISTNQHVFETNFRQSTFHFDCRLVEICINKSGKTWPMIESMSYIYQFLHKK